MSNVFRESHLIVWENVEEMDNESDRPGRITMEAMSIRRPT